MSLLLYRPSLDYGFVKYDDHRILVQHPELYNQGSLIDSLKTVVLDAFPREEPLLVRDISWIIDSRIFGFDNPRGFHFGNVFLHALVVSLAFLFILLATRRYRLALLTSSMFLLLAVHVEPLAWVMGRKDILIALFALLALIAQHKMLSAVSRLPKSVYYIVSLLFFVLALFSKISALVLPGVLYLHIVFSPYLSDADRSDSRLDARKLLRALLLVVPHMLLSAVVFVWYKGVISAFGVLDRGYAATPLQHIVNVVTMDPLVLLAYLKNVLLPMRLTLFYAWPGQPASLGWSYIAISCVVILLLGALSIYLLRKQKTLAFYYLSFFVLMIPYMNIIYAGIWAANRYMYLSSLFLLALLCSVALRAIESSACVVRWLTILLLSLVCIFNLVEKIRYQKVWRDDIALWSHEMSSATPPVDAFYNMASHYYDAGIEASDASDRQGLFSKAQEVIDDGLRRSTGDSSSLLFVRALISIVQNEPEEQQLEALLAVESLRPDYAPVLWQLCVFHYKEALKETAEGRREERARLALSYCARYVREAPRDYALQHKLASMRREFAADFPFMERELETVQW